MNYPNKLKFLKDRNKLSAKELADIIGVHRNFIYEVLKGNKIFSRVNEDKIIEHFGLRYDYWMDDVKKTVTTEDGDELYYELFPEARNTRFTRDKMREFLKLIGEDHS